MLVNSRWLDTLGRRKIALREMSSSGKKFRVSVPENLHVLGAHDDQRQARWDSFGVFIPYNNNAITDPGSTSQLLSKPTSIEWPADIIPLPAWKNGVMVMLLTCNVTRLFSFFFHFALLGN